MLIMNLVELKNVILLLRKRRKSMKLRSTRMKMKIRMKIEMKIKIKIRKKTRNRMKRSSINLLKCKKRRKMTNIDVKYTIPMDRQWEMCTGISTRLFVQFMRKVIDLLKANSIHNITAISRHMNTSTKSITEHIVRFTPRRPRMSTDTSTSTITLKSSMNTAITMNMLIFPSL